MSDLTPITREEALLDGEDLEPITRKEQFIKRIYDKTQEVPTPITREEWFLNKAGEGGGGVTIEQLNATENGTYSEQGKAYSPVIVNVPLPSNAHLATPITSQPIANASAYPLPKCDVTVSNADKCEVIVTNDGQITEDSVPYLNRHSAGGDTELDEIIGGTVAWNQLADFSKIPSADSVTYTSDDGKSVTLNGSTTTVNERNGWYSLSENQSLAGKYSHKVFFSSKSISGTLDGELEFLFTGSEPHLVNESFVASLPSSGQMRLATQILANSTLDNYKITFICIDITQMFGTTIADYIYSLEQATAGSGIAWLKSYGFLTKDYYPYNAGELMSVKTSARKVYDSNSNLLATYPFSDVELRGIPKLVNNQLVYDGDRYEGNGRVTRKYGIVDLGGLTWSYNSDLAIFISKLNDAKVINQSRGVICVCDKYLSTGYASISWSAFPDKYISAGNNYSTSYNLAIKDTAYTDTTAFKTAVSGVYLVYELTTPTTEQTSPYDNPQLAGSTEEFVDTREVAIPVGHESKYFNGEGYITYLEPNTSDTIDMAQEHAIMPLETTYISANGTLDVEYWK